MREKVTKVLDEAGLAYEIYSDIKANPTIENVQNGVAAFKKAEADYIVAIGGGSSMDTVKAIGIIIANPEFEDVRSLEGVAPTKNPCVPIIAVVDPDMMSSMPKGLHRREILKEEDLQFLAESAYADACAPGNPKEASVEDLKALFRKLM